MKLKYKILKCLVIILPVLIITLTIIIYSNQKGEKVQKPIPVEDLLQMDSRVPVHFLGINSDNEFRDIKAEYYYTENSDGYMKTYFLFEDEEGIENRVVKLWTCVQCGGLVEGFEIEGKSSILINWAKGTVLKCTTNYDDDLYSGEPFQSSLLWMDHNLNSYRIFSIWSIEKTTRFINSLELYEPVEE